MQFGRGRTRRAAAFASGKRKRGGGRHEPISRDGGILICGTGLGVSIAANKVKGAYAALLSDVYSAERARKSNDANIACFGAFTIGIRLMEKLAETFLTSEFEPGCASQPKVDGIRSCE